MKPLRLLPQADRRVRLGHLWIFANEVDVDATPLRDFAAGELAVVHDARGGRVVLAYVNPAALICARILSTSADATIDTRWFAARMRRALALRERLYPSPHYRAVYGESDGLAGLVIDRYGDTLSVQLNTAGMVAMRRMVLAAIEEVFSPSGILLGSAASVRALEGLAGDEERLGEVLDEVEVLEGGLLIRAPLLGGQKTGYYYDQRENRLRVGRYAAGSSLLDVYSYVGAWALAGLACGASAATCVDASQTALDYSQANAERLGHRIECLRGDALEVLERLGGERRTFGVVIVDPPALAKRRRDLPVATAHYRRINAAALKLVAEGGTLVSASCSQHLPPEGLARLLLDAARLSGRRFTIVERHAHPPDHPIHPAMPQTEYLKTFFCAVW
ncbi:MAG: class I SAM-dependent rRNA methyltransferase [Vulcanimicrobiaceae bacterium]